MLNLPGTVDYDAKSTRSDHGSDNKGGRTVLSPY